MRSIIEDIMVEVISFLAIVTKGLIGNTDVEDVLERLDKLTQEEARMASAELLRVTHDVEGRVICADEAVQGVDKGVRDVGDKVEGVQHKVQDVDKRVQDIRDAVMRFKMSVTECNAFERRFKVLTTVDQLDRESSQRYDCARFPALTIISQGTTSENAFKLGSLPQIHPLVITFPVIITHPGCGIRPPVRPVVTTHGPFASHLSHFAP